MSKQLDAKNKELSGIVGQRNREKFQQNEVSPLLNKLHTHPEREKMGLDQYEPWMSFSPEQKKFMDGFVKTFAYIEFPSNNKKKPISFYQFVQDEKLGLSDVRGSDLAEIAIARSFFEEYSGVIDNVVFDTMKEEFKRLFPGKSISKQE